MNHHHPGDCATYLRASGWTCLPPEHQQSARAAADPELSLDAKAVYLMHVVGGGIVGMCRPADQPKVIAGWKELTAANYLGPF